ncbi:MAG: class I SAM-dependent methyltransferase, partial [Acidimicrobiaceae bacterium]|nr:class I SAM-dependent methyltransferase [Acidimicrobiaceae bacterium]
MTANLASPAAAGPQPPLLEAALAAALETRLLARYRWAGQFAKGRRVVDVGCGFGRGAAILAGQSPSELVGVEQNEAVVEAARSEVPAGVQVLRAELDQLPFSAASFDLGLSFGARQPGRTDPVTELLRVVEPQGLLLVSAEADETQVLRALLSERRGQVAVAEEHDLAGAEVAAVQPRGRTGEEPVTVASRRGDDWVPGSTQTRVILMASDAPLPAIEPVAVADDLRSTEQWLQYDDEQRRLIRELEIRIRELEGLLAERNRIRGELRLTEQVLAV